ncbi:MAG: lysine exporter LysO family protein [Candidatus Cloacimonadales bacterium]|jgi:uncharacterized membrane protein YbjE (DUF340 family)|nr:lysine exporter LysO family protein [Candidatus Cloacimonadota bacterium]MDD2649878.1 lysine exporter LysO family protein [Candidatus Cloacimonadota bacterium]MDD3502190.1 lysine exporter LysO family protein [Candidatus Cloacimonadota bacterium]MDX9976919.1 lysine exporter LysO family protein [Candidatus Cloacimonadales bacterium]
MHFIIIAIIAGMIVGSLWKKQAVFHDIANVLSTISVYFLLFFLGLSTAFKQELFTSFKELGAISIILSFAGMLGSALALIPVNIYLNKNKKILWSHLELIYNEKPHKSANVSDSILNNKSQDNMPKQENKHKMFYPLTAFLLGFLVTLFFLKTEYIWIDKASDISLYSLIFFTGIGIGKINIFLLIKKYHIFALLIPFIALIGSMLMGALIGALAKTIDVKQAIAVSSGMGYYSISALICGQNFGEFIGIIALFANLLREFVTMMFAPILVKLLGKLSPIGTGGATAMDTTLPFIKQSSGSEFAIIGLISGVVLTIIVPIVITFVSN